MHEFAERIRPASSHSCRRHSGKMCLASDMEAATHEPVRATPPATLESFNPTTGERIGSVPTVQPGDVQAIVNDVATVQPFWAQLPIADRGRYMKRTAQAIIDSLDELTTLLTREQGKPRNESYSMELLPTIDALHWIADAGAEILADERVSHPIFLKQKRAAFAYEPLGVVGVISPWNYPWSIPFGEVAIAVMCGNGVVLKPAPLTPLIADRIQWVFERAGVPEGLVRVIHGGGDVGQALVESSAAKVFFTGSVAVGRRVGAACAERLKDSVLELGGKDPMIVLADANLPNAISGALWGGFANAGQTCAGIERVYVMRDVADRFVEGVVSEAEKLTVGDPMEWETEVGPMVWRDQFELVRELVDDAVASGATMHCGGPVEVAGYPEAAFFAPTVLTGVTHEMRIMREEIFGPVLPIVTVDSEEEAIGLANDSEFGLGASVWTLDRARGDRIARRIESGMVWLNDHMYSHGACSCSWGGVKDSGLGRSHSKFGFYECVNIKLLAWEPSRTRNFWWHPYDEALGKAMHAAAQLLYGRDADKAGALRRGAVPLAKVARKTLRDVLKR
jgi:acyl-CoA reductase-like NAD-dependent aldehyde dehydrogenase